MAQNLKGDNPASQFDTDARTKTDFIAFMEGNGWSLFADDELFLDDVEDVDNGENIHSSDPDNLFNGGATTPYDGNNVLSLNPSDNVRVLAANFLPVDGHRVRVA